VQRAWIELEYPVNVRDLGGLPTTDGRTVRFGRIVRADNVDSCTALDVEQLSRLGVTHVLDLRAKDEVAERAEDAPISALTRSRLPLLARDLDREANPMNATTEFDFANHYVSFTTVGAEHTVAALTDVAEHSESGTIIHCAAGKDRTGVLIALILLIVGVGHDEIIADYALSADRVERIKTRMVAEGYTIDAWPPAVFEANPQTMATFLTRFTDLFGTPDNWAERTRFPAELLARLRTNLLD
jgi:protein-tyrosine phosphatase